MTRVEIKPGSPVEKRLIKNEDSGDETLQLGLPDIAEDSIFDDVDVEDEESEYVDGNFEGLVFINGIEHFVCPGKLISEMMFRCLLMETYKGLRSDSFLHQ